MCVCVCLCVLAGFTDTPLVNTVPATVEWIQVHTCVVMRDSMCVRVRVLSGVLSLYLSIRSGVHTTAPSRNVTLPWFTLIRA